MRVRVALVLVIAGAWAPAAVAGGWASVGLSSTPGGVPPGQPWVVELTVLQHGVTPLEGVRPAVEVTPVGGVAQSTPALPTGRPGVYRARVALPAGGDFRYVVDDGFSRRHTYPMVSAADRPRAAATVAPPASGPPWGVLAIASVAALTVAAALVTMRRRRGLPGGARVGTVG